MAADQRRTVATPVAERLRAARSETVRAADGPMPAVADVLRRMADDEEAAANALVNGVVPPEPADRPEQRLEKCLLAGVVLRGLRLADETDPIRRADCCAELADEMVQASSLAAAGGEKERAGVLVGRLEEVLDHGVTDNLTLAEQSGLEGYRQEQHERITQKAAQVQVNLQANLERAPEEMRQALEEARKGPHVNGTRPNDRTKGKDRSDKNPRK
jgi:hypothetical protein